MRADSSSHNVKLRRKLAIRSFSNKQHKHGPLKAHYEVCNGPVMHINTYMT